MSVKMFKGIGIQSPAPTVYSAESGEVSASLYAVKCSLKVTVPIASQTGGRRSQIVVWDSPGSTLQEAINNAGDVAQFILDRTKGYSTMFTMQLGLFRPDVEGTPMDAGELAYGSVVGTNAKTSAGVLTNAKRVKYSNLYIPFIKDDVERSTLKSAFQALCTAGKIGAINFHDANKNSFDVATFSAVNGCQIKDYDARILPQLTNDDSSSGIGDGTLSKDPS